MFVPWPIISSGARPLLEEEFELKLGIEIPATFTRSRNIDERFVFVALSLK